MAGMVSRGRPAIRGFLETVWSNFAGFRTVATAANAQPAVGVYARTHQDPDVASPFAACD